MTPPAFRDLKQKFGAWARDGFVPEPISGWEWLIMRLGFAGLVMWAFRDWHPFVFEGQPSPTGLARLVPLTWLHHDGMFEVMLWLGGLCCMAYVLGIAWRWVLP